MRTRGFEINTLSSFGDLPFLDNAIVFPSQASLPGCGLRWAHVSDANKCSQRVPEKRLTAAWPARRDRLVFTYRSLA